MGGLDLLVANAGDVGVYLTQGPSRRPPAGLRPRGLQRRNTEERCINRLNNLRGPATRYEKTATVFQAGPHIVVGFIRSAR
ncbi:hypothetical protein ACIBJF_47495 [Streptomyces sp. NPDC050743]|uniref:hypothetical protein n=1 Tax=Streptomyces sp. NPDC050743 TaxID=3365634 RepID=UPI0037AE9B61